MASLPKYHAIRSPLERQVSIERSEIHNQEWAMTDEGPLSSFFIHALLSRVSASSFTLKFFILTNPCGVLVFNLPLQRFARLVSNEMRIWEESIVASVLDSS